MPTPYGGGAARRRLDATNLGMRLSWTYHGGERMASNPPAQLGGRVRKKSGGPKATTLETERFALLGVRRPITKLRSSIHRRGEHGSLHQDNFLYGRRWHLQL